MSKQSNKMTFRPGKGEIMIVGSKADICSLAASQKEYVSSENDVTGAITCVSLGELSTLDFRGDNVITCIDHLGETNEFKTGFQCRWLWNGNRTRPMSWHKEIERKMGKSIDKLYSLGVFFENGTSTPDGNPFIGGTQDEGEKLIDTALRELREEVGLSVKEGSNMYEVPTASQYKKIWMVDASNVC
jgi:hypothetical protein